MRELVREQEMRKDSTLHQFVDFGVGLGCGFVRLLLEVKTRQLGVGLHSAMLSDFEFHGPFAKVWS